MPSTKAETLTALAEAIDAITVAPAVQDIQRFVHSAARRLTEADGATLIVREDGYCHYVGEDAIAPLWKGRRFPIDECVSGWSMLRGEPIAIEDVFADPRIRHSTYRRTFVKSLLLVPIGTLDALGAIGIYWAHRHEATADEIALVRALGGEHRGRAGARTADAGGRAPPGRRRTTCASSASATR